LADKLHIPVESKDKVTPETEQTKSVFEEIIGDRPLEEVIVSVNGDCAIVKLEGGEKVIACGFFEEIFASIQSL
jgi:hypothetical protein